MKNETNYWKVKAQPLIGHQYEDVLFNANPYIKMYRSPSSGRKPFIRTVFFKKRKVFFDFFWIHLFSKPVGQRKKRLQLFPCGIELLKKTTIPPEVTLSTTSSEEKLYRLFGRLQSDQKFVVQIKETPQKSLHLMSMFFWEKE